MIQGKKTGTANGVSSIGLLGHTLDASPGASAVEQDASFTVNGIRFTRSSNTVADAIDGVNLNLVSSAPGVSQTIRVSAGAENSEKMITDMVTAYNDLMAYYTTQTATIANSKTPGTFANQPTMLGFIAQIKSKMANGIRYLDSATGQPQQLSLSAIGMDLQLDGTIKFNSITHAQSVAQGLQAKLAQGGRIGYVDATNDLSTFLRSEISFSGDINSQINAQKANVQDMQKRQAQLQTRLDLIQRNYFAQYSNLNSLLFQLSSTSNSLSSALTALTNMSASE